MQNVVKSTRPAHVVQGRRRSTILLEELTTYFHELIENSPVAILVLDPNHRVQMCNPAFERLFGYDRKELSGANLKGHPNSTVA